MTTTPSTGCVAVRGILRICAVLAAAAVVGCAVAPRVDIEAETGRLRAAMEQINRAWETEDMDLFSRGVAHDPDMVSFGADVGDRWVGWKGLEAGLREQFEVFSDTEVTPRHLDIHVAPDGSTGWAAQAMGIRTKFLGNPVELEARITAVFEKRDGSWRLVQFHYSVPMSESRRLAT